MAEGGGPSTDACIEDIERIEREEENQVISNRIFLSDTITGQTQVVVNNAQLVTSGPITINNYGGRRKKPKKIKPSKPLTTSTEKLSTVNLHHISENLGLLWRNLGRLLGHEDAALEQLDLDHERNSNERNYQMLRCWTSKEGKLANKAQLAKHLADCGLGKMADYLADS
ncbi:receptor-interacting serine/threonine-protein kinase 1 [Elysia marginata]|uniref:Receptor-interacting serine/threonine-protein kinase 1 n=1 Tax=Elysia marginata TaxID=1093978 RepID=A0AAV4HF82_9GAST|nr:receptor-interacting serine/threonine-protein kinase 1 [Elysia marginata]